MFMTSANFLTVFSHHKEVIVFHLVRTLDIMKRSNLFSKRAIPKFKLQKLNKPRIFPVLEIANAWRLLSGQALLQVKSMNSRSRKDSALTSPSRDARMASVIHLHHGQNSPIPDTGLVSLQKQAITDSNPRKRTSSNSKLKNTAELETLQK